jgi:hypothetical protein
MMRKYILVDVEYAIPDDVEPHLYAEYAQGVLTDINKIPGVTGVSTIDQGDADEIAYNPDSLEV